MPLSVKVGGNGCAARFIKTEYSENTSEDLCSNSSDDGVFPPKCFSNMGCKRTPSYLGGYAMNVTTVEYSVRSLSTVHSHRILCVNSVLLPDISSLSRTGQDEHL